MTKILLGFVVFTLIVAALPLEAAQAQTPALSVNPKSGTVGTEVTIQGTGFTGSLATVYYDKFIVAEKIRISETGQFTATFNVPESSRGNHQVKAVDNTQPYGSSAHTTFTMLPRIKVEPSVAKVGTSVAVIGNGFAEAESGIRILIDGKEVGASANANYFGSWGINIPISGLSKGDHTVNAFGTMTPADEVAGVVLIVGPLLKMVPQRGPVGTVVQFNGYSFNPAEDGCTITYDGKLILYNVVANTDGSWEVKVNIPPSTAGFHEIGAYGTYTSASAVPKLKFEVLPSVRVVPDSGEVGGRVKVNGTGFGAEQTITLSFEQIEIGVVTSDKSGSFEYTFQVPETGEGVNKVTAVDSLGNSAQVDFNLIGVEGAPPSVPQILSPKDGSQIRIFPSAMAAAVGFAKNFKIHIPKIFLSSSIVSFDWGDVTDLSGVSYAFQVATTPAFSELLVNKKGLASSEYTLSEIEALPPGDYYWRIQAVDGAGNAGSWTETQRFQVHLMSSQSLIVFIVSIVVIVGLIVFLCLYWRYRRAYYL